MAIFKPTTNYAVAGLPISLTVGDFNGDGKSDLVVGTGNTGTGNFSVLLGTGVSGLSTATNYVIFDPSQLPVVGYLAVGDFNGDGKSDLVAAGNATQATAQAFLVALGSGSSSLFSSTNLNISGGTFNLPPNLSTIYPTSVAIGDFNRDGKSDLALTTYSQGIVSVAFGNGTGGFGATTNFNVGSGPASVKTGDFNGDGKSDLVVANDASNNVSILLGNGTGGFGATTNFNVGLNPLSVVVGDFNGDGKSDLATANFSSNNVSVLLGNGNGTFGTATNFAVGTSPYALTVGDLDGNGSPDLAVTNFNSNNVSVLYNDSTQIIGNSINNSLTGTQWNDTINGAGGADTLTGLGGADTFVFQFGQSLVSGADRITDFAIGTDKIDLLSSTGLAINAPTGFSRAANSAAATLANVVNNVFTDANGGLAGNQALGINRAALVSVTTAGIAGTYLVINNGIAGFQSTQDLVVNLTGYTGTLPSLGSIAVSSFFV
jgi:hypothetical protein